VQLDLAGRVGRGRVGRQREIEETRLEAPDEEDYLLCTHLPLYYKYPHTQQASPVVSIRGRRRAAPG